MSATLVGGQAPSRQQLEERRQTLIDTRLARMGELAALRTQATGLETEIARLEGGVIEIGQILAQMAPHPPPEEE